MKSKCLLAAYCLAGLYAFSSYSSGETADDKIRDIREWARKDKEFIKGMTNDMIKGTEKEKKELEENRLPMLDAHGWGIFLEDAADTAGYEGLDQGMKLPHYHVMRALAWTKNMRKIIEYKINSMVVFEEKHYYVQGPYDREGSYSYFVCRPHRIDDLSYIKYDKNLVIESSGALDVGPGRMRIILSGIEYRSLRLEDGGRISANGVGTEGGGAISLFTEGDVLIEGSIEANGGVRKKASGGYVYIKCAGMTVAGTGRIDVNGFSKKGKGGSVTIHSANGNFINEGKIEADSKAADALHGKTSGGSIFISIWKGDFRNQGAGVIAANCRGPNGLGGEVSISVESGNLTSMGAILAEAQGELHAHKNPEGGRIILVAKKHMKISGLIYARATKFYPTGSGVIRALYASRDFDSADFQPEPWVIDTKEGAPLIETPFDLEVLNVATPDITGTAKPFSFMDVFVDGILVERADADSQGIFRARLAEFLAEGEHEMNVVETDISGATISSLRRYFTVDTLTPEIPEISEPENGFETTNTKFTIKGNAEKHSTVTIYDGNVELGQVIACEDGSYTFPAPHPYVLGTHDLTASAKDAAGNVSCESSTVRVTILEEPHTPE